MDGLVWIMVILSGPNIDDIAFMEDTDEITIYQERKQKKITIAFIDIIVIIFSLILSVSLIALTSKTVHW